MSLLAIIRGLHFASLMIVFGAESLGALAEVRIGRGTRVSLPKPMLIACAAIALTTAVVSLLITTAQMSGGGLVLDRAALTLVLEQTLFGKMATLRIGLLVALTGAIATSAPVLVRIALAAAALAAIAWTGHVAAAGAPQFHDLRAAIDAGHLLAAGFWLGGLAVLARMVVGAAGADAKRLLAVLRLFSSWGLGAVAILVGAGSLNAYLVLFSGAGAWSPTYLTLLATKIVLAAVMVALALTNRFGLVPALARGDADARESLTISVIAELALGIVIVAIVGVLGLVAPRV